MKNKKGVSMYLVGAIILLIVFFILFAALPRIINILKSGAEHQLCSITAVFNQETKDKSLGVPWTDISCPYDRETVTMSELNKNVRGVNSKIAQWNEKHKGTIYEYKETDPQIYNLNKFVAGEMKQCWEKFGAGDMDLFPNWWKPFKSDECNDALSCLKFWHYEFQQPPRFCVICSRIRVDPKVREYVHSTKVSASPVTITSLYEWMGNNEVPLHKGFSYLEYVEDDVHTGLWATPESYYYKIEQPDIPDKPLAIVYIQQNVFEIEGLATKFANIIGLSKDKAKPVHSLEIFPMEEIKERCDVLES